MTSGHLLVCSRGHVEKVQGLSGDEGSSVGESFSFSFLSSDLFKVLLGDAFVCDSSYEFLLGGLERRVCCGESGSQGKRLADMYHDAGFWLPILARVVSRVTGVTDYNIVQNNGKFAFSPHSERRSTSFTSSPIRIYSSNAPHFSHQSPTSILPSFLLKPSKHLAQT